MEGAVSLTFDDGLPTQLVTAVPVLDSNGLHGTFYVNAGPEVPQRRSV
jgi:peptidoglycan/xylan/chitin deacetylase (PgdA/CDA1 family)